MSLTSSTGKSPNPPDNPATVQAIVDKQSRRYEEQLATDLADVATKPIEEWSPDEHLAAIQHRNAERLARGEDLRTKCTVLARETVANEVPGLDVERKVFTNEYGYVFTSGCTTTNDAFDPEITADELEVRHDQVKRRSAEFTLAAAREHGIMLGSPSRGARRRSTTSPARARPRGAGRPKARGAAKRSSARSGDSGDDSGEPEPAARVCACGCARDISHKRAGARTFDASCRKRLSRTSPGGGQALPGLDALADDIREDRRTAWAAAANGETIGYAGLTDELAEELLEIDAGERLATSRATTPRPTEMDALSVHRWLMESNGVYTGRRPGSSWNLPDHRLRTRAEVVA